MEFSTASTNNDLICLREFLSKRTEIVQEDYFKRHKNIRERVQNEMDLSDERFASLEQECSAQLLLNSETVASEIEDLDSEYLSVIDFIRNAYSKAANRMQSTELNFKKELDRLSQIEPSSEEDTIKTPDIVLTMQLSQPLNPKLRKLFWSEDFYVLGENYLTDVLEKITCFRKEIRIGEFSENPDDLYKAKFMKDCIKSGFFLIENTFYNDLRFDNNDCSKPLIETLKIQNLGTYNSAHMEKTKFIDLNIRLGFPYLYNHIGNCEHLLIFTNLRLVNPAIDSYCISHYPMVKDKCRGRFTFCWCCNKLYAKWIVCNSEYAVDDPTFLCERCLRNTHYELVDDDSSNSDEQRNQSISNKKLKKLFDFKAYHFSQI